MRPSLTSATSSMERVPSVLSVYGRPARVGGPGDRELAVGVGDAGEAGGRQHQRERQRTPEEGRGRVGRAHAPQDARVEPDAAEGGRVLGHGVLVFGAAVDVVEHATRQPAPGHDPQIVHVGGPGEATLRRGRARSGGTASPTAVFRSSDEC